MTAPTAVAWRFWRCRDGRLYSPFAPQLGGGDPPWEPGLNRARCLAGSAATRALQDRPPDHAPGVDPRCGCGFFASTLPELLRVLRLRQAIGFGKWIPDAFSQIELTGLLPPETGTSAQLRGEFAELVGPVLLARELAASAAAMAGHYGVDVVLSDLPRREWLNGVAAGWRAYQADPLALGERLYRPVASGV